MSTMAQDETTLLSDLSLSDLSDELLLQVFVRLCDPPKLVSCTRLNRRFCAVLSDDGLWKDILLAATEGKQPPRNGVTLGLNGEAGDTYRKAYIRIMYDISRLDISCDELINSTWQFYFNSDMYLFHASPEQAAQRAGVMGNQDHMAKFSDTGFFSSTISGAPSRRTPTRWHLLARSEADDSSPTLSPLHAALGGPRATKHESFEATTSDKDDKACAAAMLADGVAGREVGGVGWRASGAFAHAQIDQRREECANAAERRMEGGTVSSPSGGPVSSPRTPSERDTPPSERDNSPSERDTPPSPLLFPSRSPSGDFSLLVSAVYGSYVQVGSYPLLRVSRTQNWGWCLTNKFVTIISANRATEA